MIIIVIYCMQERVIDFLLIRHNWDVLLKNTVCCKEHRGLPFTDFEICLSRFIYSISLFDKVK